MSWNEEASKTCNDCGGYGGWARRDRITKEIIHDTCERCAGYGSIAWGA